MKQSPENMNIALVHDWLTNHAGAERVLEELSRLYPKATIFTSVYDPKKASPYFLEKKVVTSYLQKIPFMKSKRELLIPLTPFAFEQFDFGKFDLVITSTTMAAKGILTKPTTTHVCYCHTPPRYLWEPETDTRASAGKFSGLRRKISHQMRIWDKIASDRPDYYIANSKYDACRIKKYYGKTSEVIYPPVETNRFFISKKEEIEDYFLFVSRLVPYKKCDLVIQAFNDLKLPLKIIGSGPKKESLQKLAKSNIEFLGYLSDEEMAKYYSRAKAFVFASEEDFGIVPVEAMASGRPVIAFNRGGATETVVHGKTGLLFDEQTPQCLTDAVLNFKDTFDPKEIRAQAEKFNTESFVRNFSKYIESVLAK